MVTPTEITFRAIPNGHEFTSLLLAILNLDGKGKNFPDEAVCNRVKALEGSDTLSDLCLTDLHQLSGCSSGI